MPTSTFGKQFEVRHEKAADFVREMSKSVAPTLRQDFHSNMVFLHQNTRLKESLIRALNVRCYKNPTLKKGTAHNDARNDSCNCQLMQSEMAIVFYVMKYLNQKKA